MKTLCGVKLTHNKYYSMYECSVPLDGSKLRVALSYRDTEAKLPEMIATAESVIQSRDKFLACAVPPLRKHLLRLKYVEYANLEAFDFVEPSLYISEHDDYYLFDLLLNLPELKENEYHLKCSFRSLDAIPSESDVELVSNL